MLIDKFFTEEGYLPSFLPGYRPRPVQEEAARIIASSMDNFRNAVIEAPTGSGKTMAYLIPAFAGGKKIIISTKTKQLMRQLMLKDVPVVQKFVGSKYSVKLLKGRKNYFCPQRFYRLVLPNAGFYADAVNWYEDQVKNGITEAPWGKLDSDVCNLMTADRFQCRVSRCPYYSVCPFYLQRQEANDADVIITNHHLFLSDMGLKASGSQGSIFDFRDHAVFDEAHSLPDIYAQYAGAELSLFGLTMFFRENKDVFGPAETEGIQSLYFSAVGSMNEGRALYDAVKDGVRKLVEAGSAAVEKTGDKELAEEYGRYVSGLEEIERDREGVRIAEKNEHRLSVKFIPTDAGESFAEGLRETVISSVFISATISAGGRFDYFLAETGLKEDETDTAVLPAAFNFKKQARLFVPSEKDCLKKDDIYLKLAAEIKGSVLIICNSIERMWKVGEIMQSRAGNKKIILQNGADLTNLSASQDVILIGCASLREGIDLSGGGFRCVILDKLPFEYFEDFFLKSKAEKVERETGGAFVNFYLPRAVLYFKQAAGRLIRHEEDSGVWAVLDHRILSKSYGKYFLDVLDNVKVVRNVEDALKFIDGGAYE